MPFKMSELVSCSPILARMMLARPADVLTDYLQRVQDHLMAKLTAAIKHATEVASTFKLEEQVSVVWSGHPTILNEPPNR